MQVIVNEGQNSKKDKGRRRLLASHTVAVMAFPSAFVFCILSRLRIRLSLHSRVFAIKNCQLNVIIHFHENERNTIVNFTTLAFLASRMGLAA